MKIYAKRLIGTALACLMILSASLLLISWDRAVKIDNSTVMTGYREPLTEGVSNTITNALYMYNTFWTPLKSISAWGTAKKTKRQFVEGHTYRGIPYGQPVHNGAYVGFSFKVSDFVNAVNDPDSPLYTDRGANTWDYTENGGDIKYSPYFSNDCSGFVSSAMRIKRHTTRDIGADQDMFPVKGSNVKNARPGDLINSHISGHVIMVLDVEYDREGGSVISISTIEQTPDIIVVRTYGRGGANGGISDLQDRVTNGQYYLCRYRDIESVELIDGAREALPKVVNGICEPSSILTVDKSAEGSIYVDFSGKSFTIEGYSLTSGKVRYEYSIDGGAYKNPDHMPVYSELMSPALGFSYLKQEDPAIFIIDVPVIKVSEGSHINIRAVKDDGSGYEVADLTVRQAPLYVPFDACVDSFYMQFNSSNVQHFEAMGTTAALQGWCASDSIIRFEIKTDDGLWRQLGPSFRKDVYDYIGRDYPSCVECNSFNCAVDATTLSKGKHTVTLRAVGEDGLTFTVCTVTAVNPGIPFFVFPAAGALATAAVIIIVLLAVKKSKKKKADKGSSEKIIGANPPEDSSSPEAPECIPAADASEGTPEE